MWIRIRRDRVEDGKQDGCWTEERDPKAKINAKGPKFARTSIYKHVYRYADMKRRVCCIGTLVYDHC